MASNIDSTSLPPTEAWIFYKDIYTPKVFYPSKITACSDREWKHITRKFTNAIIRKMGFNCHTARAVVFGPRRYGGIGLESGVNIQGTEGILHFYTHVQSKSRVGILMMNTLSQLQLFSGQGRCLLENPQPLPNRKPRNGSNLYRWYHL